MSRLALLTVTAVLVLAGCTGSSDGDSDKSDGGETSKSPSATPTPVPTGPDCAGIWKNGETLPKDYTRCVDGGAYGIQEVTECLDGTQLVAFDDEFFAITGGPISKPDVAPMQDTEEFSTAFTTCTGE